MIFIKEPLGVFLHEQASPHSPLCEMDHIYNTIKQKLEFGSRNVFFCVVHDLLLLT